MKKESKAARAVRIYAEHGIQYDSSANKIYAPILDKWITPLLVNGNEKIGKGVYHFSTLAGTKEYHLNINVKAGKIDRDNPFYIDVPGTCVCDCEKCYAMSGNYLYETTLAYLAIRTFVARYDLDFFKAAVMAQIEIENIQLVRIHASGEFFSAEYIQAWKDIASAYPGTVFWSYTKNSLAENSFDDIPNCNIVKSRLPDMSLNYGTIREILDKYAMLKAAGKTVYICRCGIDDNQHCVKCTGCTKHDYVLFIKHGDTSYNAKRDPLFPAIVALIESQDKEIAGIK